MQEASDFLTLASRSESIQEATINSPYTLRNGLVYQLD